MADPIGAKITVDISEIRARLKEANRLIKENETQWRVSASAMDDWTKSEEGLTGRLKTLDKQINTQADNVKYLVEEKEKAIKQYGEESAEVAEINSKLNTQLKALERSRKEYKQVTASLEKLKEENADANDEIGDTTDESKKATKALDKLEKSAEDAGEGFTIAKGAISGFIANGLSAVVSMAGNAIRSLFGLTEATAEYRREMARVTTVADQVGVSGDRIIDKWIDLNAVIQDESSVTEGLNNLMTAGFTAEKELDSITKALEGASIQWAETLRFEGLSDSLQEWIGSKGASLTGQFAELLERLGYNLEDVEAATNGMTDAQRRNWAIQTLNKAGLDEVSEAYRNANSDIIDFNKANSDLLNAQSMLGEQMQPLSTQIKQSTADILYSFVDMIEGIDGAGDQLMYNIGYLAGSIWKNLGDLWKKLQPVFTDFVTEDIPEFIGSIVAKVPAWIASIATAVWTEAPTIVSSLIDGIVNGLQSMVDGIENELAKSILNDLIDVFSWLSDNSELVVAAIAGIVAAIATFKIIKTVTTWINAAKLAVIGLNVAMNANPISLIITAIAGLAAGLVALYHNCEPFKEWVDSLWESIKQFWEDCKVFFADLGRAFSDFWQKLKDGFFGMLDWFSQKWQDFKKIGSNIVDGIIDGIKSMGQVIKNGAQWIYDHTIGAVLNFFGINSPSTQMRDKVGKNIVSGIVDGIKSMLSALTDGARWIFDNTIGKIKGLFNGSTSIADIGKNIVSGITSGIKSMGKAISDGASWVYDNTVGRLKNILGIKSPSTVMRDEIGKNIAEGVAVGIVDSADAVAKSADTLVEAFSNGFNDAMSSADRALSESVEDAVNGAVSKVDAGKAGKGIAGEIGDAVKTATTDYSKYVEMGTSLTNVLKEGNTEENPTAIADELMGIASSLGGAWGAFADSIWGFISDNLLNRSNEEIEETAEVMVNNLLDTIIGLLTNVPQIIEGGITFLKEFAKGLVQGIPDIVRQLPEIIAGIVETLISDGIPALFEVGVQLIQGLIQGMFSINLWDVLKSIGNGIVNGFKKLFGIKSPSKVMADEVGRNLALGIEEGLTDNLKGVNNALKTGVDTSLKVDGIQRKQVNVYQTNNYAQAHSRYELYKTKHDTASAVKLALQGA